VTVHPRAAWVWRQLIEAPSWNGKPDYLIHDRDRIWGADLIPLSERRLRAILAEFVHY